MPSSGWNAMQCAVGVADGCRDRSTIVRALVAFGLVIALTQPLSSSSSDVGEITSSLRELARFYGEVRPVSGRLFGVPHARHEARESDDPRTVSSEELVALAGKSADIERRARLEPGPQSQRELADLRLLQGRSSEAVSVLELALEDHPRSPALLNDLAVSLLASYEQGGGALLLVQAVTRIEQAVELVPNMPVLLYNRCLFLGRLQLDHSAQSQCRRYLAIETDPAWGEDVERLLRQQPHRVSEAEIDDLDFQGLARSAYLEALRRAVRRQPLQAISWSEQELLPRLNDLAEAGAQELDEEWLTTAKLVAEEVAAVTGDRLLLEAVEQVERLWPSASLEQRLQLSSGFRLLAEATRRLDAFRSDFDIEEGQALAVSAGQRLEESGNPYRLWSLVLRAMSANYRADYEAALELLDPLVRTEPINDSPLLVARAHWLAGYALHVTSRPALALHHFLRSLEGYERLGDDNRAAALRMLVAESLDYLGQGEESWGYRLAAIDGSSSYPPRQCVVLYSSAEYAMAGGFNRLALMLQEESHHLALAAASPTVLAEFHWRRARIRNRLQQVATALEDMDRAREAVLEISDPLARERPLASVLLTEAEILRNVRPELASRSLTRSLELLRKKGNQYWTVELLHARADARRRLGDISGAEDDLREAIEEVQRTRASIVDRRRQASYLSRIHDVYRDLVELSATAGRVEQAFEYAELSRAYGRGNLELGESLPVEGEALLRRLDDDTLLVEIVADVNRGTVNLFVLRNDKLFFEALQFKPDLLRKIEGLPALSVTRPAEAHQLLEELSGILAAAILRHRRQESRLLIAADDVFHYLPFAALNNPKTGRLLVEDLAITYVPGATPSKKLVEGRHPMTDRQRPRRALVLADPHSSTSPVARFEALPAAERLAREMPAYFSDSTVLIGPEARRSRLLELIGDHQVLHIAGHSVADVRSPWMSHLVLADDSVPGDGFVSAVELMGLDLSHVELVVLAGCSTVNGLASRSAGLRGLTTALLWAGASQVVATLREVDDEEAESLLRTFYRRLSEGRPAGEALRFAQLDQLKRLRQEGDTAPLGSWSAFAHYGWIDQGEKR